MRYFSYKNSSWKLLNLQDQKFMNLFCILSGSEEKISVNNILSKSSTPKYFKYFRYDNQRCNRFQYRDKLIKEIHDMHI